MMVLRNMPDETSAKALANRLLQEVRWTVRGSEGAVDMSISIGICLIPTGNEKLQTIVKKADLALYQAKRTPEIGIAMAE
jgi:GGDEF domain-containing protein